MVQPRQLATGEVSVNLRISPQVRLCLPNLTSVTVTIDGRIMLDARPIEEEPGPAAGAEAALGVVLRVGDRLSVEITVTSERVATIVSLLREFLCQVNHCGLTFGISSGDAPADDATKAATGSLRPRERRVLELIERGYSNKEIAREIGVGVETVKSNVKQIFRKLAVDRRMAAVARARTLGLLSK